MLIKGAKVEEKDVEKRSFFTRSDVDRIMKALEMKSTPGFKLYNYYNYYNHSKYYYY